MNRIYDETKDMLHDALNALVKKRDLSSGGLEAVSKVVDTIKDLAEIKMFEENEDYGRRSSYRGGSSYGEDGGYSERRGGNRGGRTSYAADRNYPRYVDGYSGHGNAKHEMLEQLEEMMDKADPHQLKDIQKCVDMLHNL